MKRIPLLLTIFSLLPISVFSQVPADSEIFQDLYKADSLLFELGFNQCKLAHLDSITSADIRFYHDQGGLADKKSFMESVEQNICGNSDVKPIRKLVEGSLEVFPLYDNGKLYGAIQRGRHDFFLKRANKPLEFTSTAKFTHVWLIEGDNWVINEVLSFDHNSSR